MWQVNTLAYSPGGTTIATGGGDGKVKLWSPSSGFCFVTFTDHTAAVQDLAFVPHGRALVSASLDGTVRAFDLLRYRNFQTLVSPNPGFMGQLVELEPAAKRAIEGMAKAWLGHRSWLRNARGTVMAIDGSENHDALRTGSYLLAAQVLVAAGRGAEPVAGDGGAVAEHLAAWEGWWVRYFRFRAREGLNVEISSPGYHAPSSKSTIVWGCLHMGHEKHMVYLYVNFSLFTNTQQ